MKLRLLIVGLLVIGCFQINAQTVLKGKVVDDMYDRVVMGASIINKNQSKNARSDAGGNYIIPANEGDIILFSSIGFLPDSITVTHDMLRGTYDIALVRKVVLLEEVNVGELNAYQVDSISRREEFEHILTRTNTKLVGGKGNAPTDGVGVTFSPLSHYSKEEKNLRRFKKNYERQEKEYYIDFKFPYNHISKITGLTGDSLRTFMWQYRPEYDFCRKNSHAEMLVYINDSYRDFMDKPGITAEREKNKKREKKK